MTVLDIEEIARRRRGMESMASIASDFGVTRERIRQLLVAEYGTTWSDELSATAASEREKQLASWRASLLDRIEAGEEVTRDEVVGGSPTPVNTVEDVLGEFAWAVSFPQKSTSQYTDEQIIASMKRVWTEHVEPEPLTRETYDAYRTPEDVSGARIVQRMAWSEACAAAKVPSVPTRRAEYDRLPTTTATEWVAAFLAHAVTTGIRGSASEYDAWAREAGGPSMGSVRTVMRSWNTARAAAVPRVVTWQRAGALKPYPLPSSSGTSQYGKGEVAEWHRRRALNPTQPMREFADELGVAESTVRYHLEP